MTTQTPGGLGPPCCMGVGLGDSVPADFLFMKIGTFSGSPGEPRRCFCFLLSLRAETRTKGSGRAVDVLFRRTAFFMRGHTATKVWPEGHLLSSHEERRQRRAKGVPPLGSPGSLPAFLKRKPAGGRTPKPAYIQKRGCRPEGLDGYKIMGL